jgi:hypothetical protein
LNPQRGVRKPIRRQIRRERGVVTQSSEQAIVEFQSLCLPIPLLRQSYACRYQAAVLEPERLGTYSQCTLHQQARARQQHQGKRHFDGNERLHQPLRRCLGVASPAPETFYRRTSRCTPRRKCPEQQRRRD